MSPMKSIESWFAKHDDGEFVRHVRTVPYLVIGSTASDSPVLFTTKPAAVLGAIGGAQIPSELAVVGGCGLPTAADIRWIARFIRTNVLFLGDLDPPDLLIFAWLREQLRRKQPKFVGISDPFLHALGVQLSRSPTIPFTPSERESVPLLDSVLPDLPRLVGSACARCLRDGLKLEMEGVLGAVTKPGRSILKAIKYVESGQSNP